MHSYPYSIAEFFLGVEFGLPPLMHPEPLFGMFFYERFKKNRIIEYTATVKGPETRIIGREEDVETM